MADPKNLIHVVITGGTIDSTWSGRQDTAVVAESSILPTFFEQVNPGDSMKFTQVCMKDSRALTQEDVKDVLKTVEESDATRILVTHGTYTMPDTARYLKANLKRHDQVIILTGSMTPLKGFELSDAPFNLGYAVAKLQELEPGVYLCMNGKVFSADEVAKSLAEGKFYSVFSDEQ